MLIGDLNKRITLQYSTRIGDGMGGFTLSWVDAATVWAALWPISAKEQVQSQGVTMTITGRIRIRYRSVLRPDWRIKYGNKFYNIVSIINPNMKNEYLDIMVKEAV